MEWPDDAAPPNLDSKQIQEAKRLLGSGPIEKGAKKTIHYAEIGKEELEGGAGNGH